MRTALEIALEMAWHPSKDELAQEMLPHLREHETPQTAALRRLADAVEWYQSRVHALQHLSASMRDPEKKAVRDIC